MPRVCVGEVGWQDRRRGARDGGSVLGGRLSYGGLPVGSMGYW